MQRLATRTIPLAQVSLLPLTRSSRSAARQSSQRCYKTFEHCTKQPSPPRSLPMPHISQLPDELLIAIFTALRDSLRFYDSGAERIDLERTVAEFLGPCRLVCRRWDGLALPLVATAIQTSDPRGLLDLIDRYALEDTVKELVVVFPGELEGKKDAKVATERRLMEEWIRVLQALGPALRTLSIAVRRLCGLFPRTTLPIHVFIWRLTMLGCCSTRRPCFRGFSEMNRDPPRSTGFSPSAISSQPLMTCASSSRGTTNPSSPCHAGGPSSTCSYKWSFLDRAAFLSGPMRKCSPTFCRPSSSSHRATLWNLSPFATERRLILEHELLQLDCPALTIVDVPTIAVSDIGRFLTGLPSVEFLAFSYFSYKDAVTNGTTSSSFPTFQLPPRLRQLAVTVRADRLVHLASRLVPRLATGLQLLEIEVEKQPYEPEPNSLEQAISDFEKACSSLGILFAHDLELASDYDYAPSTRSMEQELGEVENDCDWEETRSAGDEETPEPADCESPTSSDNDWETDDSLDYDAEDDERFAAFWSEEKRKEVFGHHDWNGNEVQKPAKDPRRLPMPPTPHLPDELLSLIFEALWDSLRFYDSGEERLDLGTTAAELIGPCRLVSTRWNLLALPVLVKSVKTKKPGMLLELAQRYGLSHQVKELVVGFEVRTEPGDSATAPVPREWISKDETCATAWWTVLHRLPAYLWQILTTWTSLERPSFPHLTCLEIRSAWNEGFAYPNLMTFEPFLPYGDCFPALEELRVHVRCDQTNLSLSPWPSLRTLCVNVITPRSEPASDTVPLIRLLHSAFLQPSCKRLRYLAITGMMCRQHLDQSLFDVVFPALEVLNASVVVIDNFDAFSISFPSALVARIICSLDVLSVPQVTSAHPQLPPLLWSLYMSTNRAGLIELPGFLSAQRASELELLEIEVIHPPSSRSEAYAASMDALRQIDAICGSRGIILAHNLPEPKVVPHWRSPLTEQPAQEDEQWNWYGKVVEPENAPWPTQRDPWAPPLEDLPSEDSFSSDDDEDSLDYDAEDDERFAPFWSEEKRNEVFGHNTGVDGTEDARTSSATRSGRTRGAGASGPLSSPYDRPSRKTTMLLRRLAAPARLECVRFARAASTAGRPASEFARHPSFLELEETLDQGGLPCFPTRGENVRVLYEPAAFYRTLLDKVAKARRRIFIASLYVGKEEKELVAALHSALRANPDLRVSILVDYLRSTREHPSPSSASLLASLSAAFPSQVDIRLFHTPALHGWQKRWVPKRFNEGWGLQHMKCYGFDDDVIMSGANLSHDYFTNRTDRYISFESNPSLADFFDSLLMLTSSYSFRVTASDTSSATPTINISWPDSNAIPSDPFENTPASSIPQLRAHAHDALQDMLQRWYRRGPAQLASPLPATIVSPLAKPNGNSRIPASRTPSPYDTFLRPVLQMGPFSLSYETNIVVPSIFRTANALATAPGGSQTMLDWTSGYFGLREDYKRLALDCKAQVRIVSASPEANGFFGSRGVSRFIPPAYTYFAQRFHEEVLKQQARKQKRGRGDDGSLVEMREWRRDGWTYHAKGIWLAPSVSNPYSPPAPSTSDLHYTSLNFDPSSLDLPMRYSHPSPPFLTLIGSSNFGSRSATRDLEAGILVTTQNNKLRWDLEHEVRTIRKYADVLVDERLFERKDRKVPWGVRVAARAIETML
ncbi:CDP-diacylglycerol--glycerol-3-phosphate 3-phosphatidyltransferase [Rhodotorula toruloides]|nr:CDP-diacylglycerol--glycerol-3-phosphate 3-phosphatidyltransferase [Rhodotorula toruloides]